MINVFSVVGLILLAFGAVLTYLSSKIAPFFFGKEDRDAESDNLKVKSIGFIIALIGAISLFILK